MQWRLFLFGPPRVERNGKPIEIPLRKGLALLVYCALTRQSHSRDALATLFWPDKDQQAARANLRRLLYELTQLLGDSLLALAAENVVLHPGINLWLDVDHYRRCLSAPAQTGGSESTAAQLARFEEAARLYAADFMAGFTLDDCPEFDDWQFFQREDLRRSLAAVLGQLVARYEQEAAWENALLHARRWLALDPLDEEVHRCLMRLYAYAGQKGAALRQYEECMRILAQELDVEPEWQTTDLYTRIRTRHFPPAKASGPRLAAEPAARVQPGRDFSVAASSLPKYTTPFVGRRLEVAELVRRLLDPDCRLLTIVGPGGMGKTRLALAAAQLLLEPPDPASDVPLPQFRDGVYFVPLQPVSTPDRFLSAVANALGLRSYEEEAPQQQLIHYLQQKEVLLVLDNFEHLLGAAELVGGILGTAPRVKLLITSREALRLQEEWFHPIAGLRLAPSGANAPEESDAHAMFAVSDAFQLFVQAGRRASAAFDPQVEQQEIARICRLVDGIPLALELAASWLKVLSCAQIAQEIEIGMDILVTRYHNVAARHRSMRVILDQSWDLLSQKAQVVLRRLSVFQGGFRPDAAAAIDADRMTLAELVDVAWIYHTPSGRYEMHELLRQYAADKLADEPGEEADTQERHMFFYLREISDLEVVLTGPDQLSALNHIEGEIDNIQAAWNRAAERNDADRIDAALHALHLFLIMRSRYMEGKQLFAAALHHFAKPAAVREQDGYSALCCRLLARLGTFHLHLGEMQAAERCFAAVVEGSTSERELAFVYARIGELGRQQGSRPAAEAALRASLSLAKASGDRELTAEALLGLSDLLSSFGEHGAGEQLAREALSLCRQLQRPDLTARALAALAWCASCLGGYAEAERYYRETLAISETIANPFGIALATNFLGWVAYCEGGERLVEAADLHAQALAIWRRIGNRSFVAMCLGDCALAAYELGAYAEAKRLAHEGVTVAEELGQSDLLSYNLNVLGAAVCSLGELAASRRYLFRSLEIAHELRMPDKAALMFYFLALLFIQEGRMDAASPDHQAVKQYTALELLAFIVNQPATWQAVRDRAVRAQTDLVVHLHPDTAAAAQTRGRQRSFDEIARMLLLEYEA